MILFRLDNDTIHIWVQANSNFSTTWKHLLGKSLLGESRWWIRKSIHLPHSSASSKTARGDDQTKQRPWLALMVPFPLRTAARSPLPKKPLFQSLTDSLIRVSIDFKLPKRPSKNTIWNLGPKPQKYMARHSLSLPFGYFDLWLASEVKVDFRFGINCPHLFSYHLVILAFCAW